jgi:hypothetical protein
LDRDQSVAGWAKWFTDGWVESVATIPNAGRDETWVIVRRAVNGATVRYIEIFDAEWQPFEAAASTLPPPYTEPVVYGYTVDSGVEVRALGGTSAVSVPHLVGKVVDIVADGTVQPRQTVPASGVITLERSAVRVLVGLPFTSRVELFDPLVGDAPALGQAQGRRVSEIAINVDRAIGLAVLDGEGRQQQVPWRSFGPAVLDAAPVPFSGWVHVEALGWEFGRAALTLLQEQPLPFHVLSVVRTVTVN